VSDPIRVLEVGRGAASAYAAKLLGDHGADVVKVEPATGDPMRLRGPFPNHQPDPEHSGTFLALNLNKRSVVADVDDVDAMGPLLAWADILVHDFQGDTAARRGMDAASLAKAYPTLVTLAITPFGQTGPYAKYQAEELTISNAGGWANLCPATHTDPTLPPLKVFGDQCALMSGIAGAMTALAVVRQARQSGVGDFIDLSQQDYVASVLEVAVPLYSYKGDVGTRFHQRSLIPWRIFHACDAAIFLVCVEQDQWERLVEFMGNPEWANLEIFADQARRAENQDMVHMFVQEFVAEWKAADLYHAAQQHRICMAPVLDFAQMGADEHLRERGFFVDIENPSQGATEYLAPAVMTTDGRASIRRRAPSLGEHNQEAGELTPRAPQHSQQSAQAPLAGVRVLDLAWAWAGPFCSLNLAHLGAEVIRVESEKRADLYRRLPVYPEDWDPTPNISGMFNQWNQGKSSLTVDLASDAGLQIVKDLIKHSDVVVQNFATGVMDRLGLGYDALREINPGIILASVSGYGQTGPYRSYMGYGPAIPPLTGLAVGTGYVGGEPEEIGISMPDPTAGITAAMAVVSALVKRDETGLGDHLDVTLWEATGVLAMEGWMNYVFNNEQPERRGNHSSHMSPHGCFPCAGEDAWISIACRDDEQWRCLAGLISADLHAHERFSSLARRQQNENDLESLISAWTADKDRWQLTDQLQAAGIPAFPTMSSADIVNDPHLNERGFVQRLEHPEVGMRAHTGIPWRLLNRPNGVRRPAPCLDADTDRVLSEILHLSDADITDLRTRSVIGV